MTGLRFWLKFIAFLFSYYVLGRIPEKRRPVQ
jgi:hypothetical protein